MFQILQILSHPFCMQNKQAYIPKVCHRITWAIIVNTRSFFDDIKLAEDFLEHGDYMQFPASTLEGDFMSIKHGIKIQRHNFPPEWGTLEPQYGPQSPTILARAAEGATNLCYRHQHLLLARITNLRPKPLPSLTTGALQTGSMNAILR